MGKNSFKKVMIVLVSIIMLCSACTINTSVESSKPKKILLKGDLHCHSKYSHDGIYPISEVAYYAKKAGFDFISITDHNTKNHFRDSYVDDTLIMIPGYELTLQRGVGHLNLFGITDFKENIGMTKLDEIARYVEDINSKGGRVQINHPKNPKYYWGAGLDFNYDYYELWNGKFDGEEFETLKFWQEELVKGNRIVATSGTDSHKSKEERYPVNCVYVEERSQEGILKALDKGNSYSTESAAGPHIKLYSGDAIMGDEIALTQGAIVKIEITDIKTSSIVKIYTADGLLKEETGIENSWEIEIPMENKGFYRVEMWKDSQTMSAFSNPLFIIEHSKN